MKLKLFPVSIDRSRLLFGALFAGSLALFGMSFAAPAPVLVSLEVTPVNVAVPVGHTLQFVATGTFSDGTLQDLTTVVAWSSGSPTIAVISNAVGSRGLATGMTPGMTQIFAQSGPVSGATTLTVTGASLVSLAVSPANPTIAAGATQQFTATGTFSDGSNQDLTASVTWSSSSTSVAKVSNAAGSSGLATGVSPGTTNIAAQSDGVVGSTTLTVAPEPGCQLVTSNSSNFTGSSISQNSYIWFTSVFTPKGLGSGAATFRFVQQKITSASFTLSVPDAIVTFDPAVTVATTTFTGGVWVTRAPATGLSGDTFFSGLSYLVPANLPGGLKNVTWSGTVIPDTAGATIKWHWTAEVYSSFSTNYNALGVKPVDDNKASQYKNSDHAGTPENFKSNGIKGGSNGGGNASTTACDATPSLVLTKAAPAITNSSQIPYTITYQNPTSKTIANIELSDTLPAGTSYLVGTGTPAPTSITGNTLTWNLPSLAPNSTATVSFRVSVTSDGIYKNTASVRFPQTVGAIVSNTVTTVRDTVPPTVTIVAGPSGNTNSPIAIFRFVTDNSAVSSVCSIDSGAFTPCSPDPATYVAGPLAEGGHVFTVRVSDAAGNTVSAVRTFVVDLTPPIVAFADPPVNPTTTNNSTPRFYFTVNGGPATTFCSVDGDPFAPCTSPFTTRSLPDGTHVVSAYAQDNAGNIGQVASYAFTIDSHAPIISIPVPPNNTVTNNRRPAFSFADVSPAGSPVTFQCHIDSDASVPCASPFMATSDVADGPHSFTVTAADAAGNFAQASLAFVVDTVAPAISIPVPPNLTTVSTKKPTFSFVENGPAGTPVTFQCHLDSEASVPCTSPFTSTTILSDGSHSLTVTGTDAAGNVGQASLIFIVDTIAPIISIPRPPTNPAIFTTATPTLVFQVLNLPPTTPVVASQCTVTDANPPYQLRAQSPPNVICDSQYTVPVANALTDGGYIFSVTATDLAGNVGTAQQPFAVDTTPNNAPILDPSRNPVLSTEQENVGAPVGPVGTLISSLVDFANIAGGVDNVIDLDNGALGVAIVGASGANGTWFYSLDNGANWSALGLVADNMARLLGADYGTRLYFQPSPGFNGLISNAITFRAWDQTQGAIGQVMDTTLNGGTTAFSTATDTAALTISAVNDAPVLDPSRNPVLSSENADAPAPTGAVGTLVSSLVDFANVAGGVDNVIDIDSGAALGVAIVGADGANGTWFYSLDNGASWIPLGTVAPNSALLLAADANSRLYFQPFPNFSGLIPSAIRFRAWDQTSGVNGAFVSTIPSGGATAFSTATDDVPLTINPVNHAPFLDASRNPVLNPEDENVGAPLGAVGTLVSSLVDFANITGGVDNVIDTDNGALLGVAVTGADTTNGAWFYSLDDGANWLPFGPVSDNSALLLAANNQTRLYFQPSTGFNGAIPDAITFRAWDQTTGANGNIAAAIPNGGNTSISSLSDTASLIVTVVHPPPVLTAPTSATNPEDTPYTFGGGNAPSVSDVNTDFLTITIEATHGTLTVGSGNGVVFNTGTGTNDTVMSFSGLTTQLNAALASLVYNPTPDYNGPATITITAADVYSQAQKSISLSITAVNDAPILIAPTSATSPEDAAYTFGGGNVPIVTDVDNDFLTITIEATHGTLTIGPGSGVVFGTGTGTNDTLMSFSGLTTQLHAALASLVYNPTPDYNGPAMLTITVTDGISQTQKSVALSITPVPDVVDDSLTTIQNTEVTFNPVTGEGGASADNFEGSPSLTSVTQGAHGTTSLDAGSVTYMPDSGYTGTDNFTYTVSSGGVLETGSVTVTVLPANPKPYKSPKQH